jgi:hypothetical protein
MRFISEVRTTVDGRPCTIQPDVNQVTASTCFVTPSNSWLFDVFSVRID